MQFHPLLIFFAITTKNILHDSNEEPSAMMIICLTALFSQQEKVCVDQVVASFLAYFEAPVGSCKICVGKKIANSKKDMSFV